MVTPFKGLSVCVAARKSWRPWSCEEQTISVGLIYPNLALYACRGGHNSAPTCAEVQICELGQRKGVPVR